MTAAPGARPLAGMAWMAASGLLFLAMTAIVKAEGQGLPAAQSAFLRFALGLPFVLPMLLSLRGLRPTPRQCGLLALRGAVHTGAVICWFFAMTRIPLAEVTALNYLNPVLVTLGAALVLGERLAARRLAAVAVALLGALVILRPGLREVGPGQLAMIGTAAGFAAGYLIAKRLSSEMPAQAIVAALTAGVALGLAPLAALVWVPVGGETLLWFLAVAALATAAHYAMTRAFAAAPLGVTQPVTFLQLVWSVLLGAALFGEPPDPFVIAGGAVIVASVSVIAWREARLARRITPPAEATKF